MIYISVRNADKVGVVPIVRGSWRGWGLSCWRRAGRTRQLTEAGVPADRVNKIQEGRPNIIDAIKNKQVQLLINTPTTKGPKTDEGKIRAAAVLHKLPIITTMTAASVAAEGIGALLAGDWGVKPLQEYYGK